MGVLDCVPSGAKISATESREVFTVSMASNSSLNLPRTDVESQSHLTSPNAGSRRWNVCWKICIDVPLVVIILTIIGLYELKVIPSHKAGFFCNDPKLSFPFTGDSISAEFLLPTVALGPPVIVLITELLKTKYTIKQRLKASIRRTLHIYRCYLYGIVFNFVTIEVLKGVTGMPRPTFFDLCEPDTAKTCNGSEFVSTFECTSTKHPSFMQYDSYHSFPSGHTSLSVHAGFFVVWYLQRRAFSWRNKSIFLVPFVQLSAIAYSAVCSLTRITDHRHHWWDVTVGAAIGFSTVFYSGFVLLNNLSSTKCQGSSKETKEDLQRYSLSDPTIVTA